MKKTNWIFARTDFSRNVGNAAAATSSNINRNNEAGRAPRTSHNLRIDPRKTVRYSDGGKSVDTKIGEKTRKVANKKKGLIQVQVAD